MIIEFCNNYSGEFDFVFFPFHPPDIDVNLEAAKSVPNAEYKDYCSYIDVPGLLNEISRCDLVIADKLHANVLSACTYTPFISIAYQPKNMDFAESLEMKEYNIRADNLILEDLTDLFEQAIASDEIQGKIKNKVIEKRKAIRDFAEQIKLEI